MNTSLRIAACQFPVSGDVVRNYGHIKNQMNQAADEGNEVIHFPETALPGYGPTHFTSFDNYDWNCLEAHTQKICGMAKALKIWVVLGTMRQTGKGLPKNSILVISKKGQVAGIYDKQRLYKSEKPYYSAGASPLVIDIKGHRCGFLICYDNCYPELYEAYRRLGAGLLFHSFLNSGTTNHRKSFRDLCWANLIIRAADHGMWISASNSSKRESPLPACIIRPDGSMKKARRNVTGMVKDEYPLADLGWTYDNRKN